MYYLIDNHCYYYFVNTHNYRSYNGLIPGISNFKRREHYLTQVNVPATWYRDICIIKNQTS